MKNKFESLLKTVLFFAKFSKIKISKKYPFIRQKCLNSTICSHFILLEKMLEDALEPAEPRVSRTFGVAGVTRLELAASGVTVRSPIRVSKQFFE
ncbi:MAG: hypothetical protein CL417_01320 [Acidimicrobiaceae bacterium]|nr:hypothetical protein [Acidimicrobiaceae bacterium]|tara:strand:+ start:14108 stop:14392 length:285 start_codon:yes stop_codon:yes gene_type:complete